VWGCPWVHRSLDRAPDRHSTRRLKGQSTDLENVRCPKGKHDSADELQLPLHEKMKSIDIVYSSPILIDFINKIITLECTTCEPFLNFLVEHLKNVDKVQQHVFFSYMNEKIEKIPQKNIKKKKKKKCFLFFKRDVT
jgi:hypothetical protein